MTEQGGVPCVGCGYDVRRLDPAGVCPECATPISDSRRGDALAFADRAWLRRVARGQSLVTIGITLTVLGLLASICLVIVLEIMLEALRWPALPAVAEEMLIFVMLLGMLAGLVTASAGAFMVTFRDPRDTEREHRFAPRRLARGGFALAFVAVAFGELTELNPAPTVQALSMALTLIGLFAFTLGLVSVLRWLAALAARIPDPRLADTARGYARFMSWAIPVLLIAPFVRPLRTAATGSLLESFTSMVATLMGCAISLVALMLLIRLLGLWAFMSSMTRALQRIAQRQP